MFTMRAQPSGLLLVPLPTSLTTKFSRLKSNTTFSTKSSQDQVLPVEMPLPPLNQNGTRSPGPWHSQCRCRPCSPSPATKEPRSSWGTRSSLARCSFLSPTPPRAQHTAGCTGRLLQCRLIPLATGHLDQWSGGGNGALGSQPGSASSHLFWCHGLLQPLVKPKAPF